MACKRFPLSASLRLALLARFRLSLLDIRTLFTQRTLRTLHTLLSVPVPLGRCALGVWPIPAMGDRAYDDAGCSHFQLRQEEQ